MKLKYYGTAAAEGIPAIFCDCDVCRHAREHRGKEIRTRSQAIVDDRLLIDFPADTYMHVIDQGLNLNGIHSCIVTHNHCDHLYAEELENRREDFAHLKDPSPLTFYCSPKSSENVRMIMERCHLDQQKRILLEVIEPYRTYQIEGYAVTPLEANHDPQCDPYIYIISDGKKRMFYGNDTGVFPQKTWEYLEREKPVFDFVSLDCTGMIQKGWVDGHMSLDTDCRVRDRLVSLRCSHEKTVWCVQHFSHNGGATHAQIERAAAAQGFLTACDGMTVEF